MRMDFRSAARRRRNRIVRGPGFHAAHLRRCALSNDSPEPAIERRGCFFLGAKWGLGTLAVIRRDPANHLWDSQPPAAAVMNRQGYSRRWPEEAGENVGNTTPGNPGRARSR